MATPEHCLYCFDSLASKLDKSITPLSLSDVQASYAAYLTHLKESEPSSSSSSNSSPAKKIPALTRLARLAGAGASSSSSSLASGASSSSSTTTTTTTTTAATSTTSTRDLVTDPNAQYPLFVTWDIQTRTRHGGGDDDGEYHLRGCIGTFSAESPLSECLSEYAIISALHDTRFHPISQTELPKLKCAVTLLTNFEDCDAWDDWVVGEHGIKIRFKTKSSGSGSGRSYSGTYLPSVAAEQGWDHEQTMLSLMRKAGWQGSRDQWKDIARDASLMQVERYRGDKEEVDFDEYQQWREWANEKWGKKA